MGTYEQTGLTFLTGLLWFTHVIKYAKCVTGWKEFYLDKLLISDLVKKYLALH